jgi:hypothetical protein
MGKRERQDSASAYLSTVGRILKPEDFRDIIIPANGYATATKKIVASSPARNAAPSSSPATTA